MKSSTETHDSTTSLLDELKESLPSGVIVDDPAVVEGYGHDIVGRYRGMACGVARPRDTAEAARIVMFCAANDLPLVPQGGATGLVGGAVPKDGELVLSLRGLDWIGEVDPDSNQLDVGAGVTLEAAQAAAAAAGLRLPIDHPARGSATIGGMVATDAGGALALRHGTMRRRTAGVEFVLANGTVVKRMDGLFKDNAGYDLTELMVGSEGTLGVITAVRLQLETAADFKIVALIGVSGLRAGLDLLRNLRSVPGLEAADLMDAACMDLVRRHQGFRPPLERDREIYLIVQCSADADVTEALADAVEKTDPDLEVAAATDTARREELWAYRELLNESIRAEGVPRKFDIALPLQAIPEFDSAMRALVADRSPDASVYIYGHIGDGNLHVNIVGPDPDDALDDEILRCAVAYGGTISAEHGIGRAKRPYLSLCRSQSDIEAMYAVKEALDPDSILAPGRVLPAGR
ncbi:MAG: FAD-binding oxidoreductase [Actinobacteria bacterium]|nr:FAD-binding oxidoreductase [Actinomycetota bacterium]